MLTIEFSEADVKALHAERFLHPHPRVQWRLEAVYLKSQQLAHQDRCRLTRMSGNTLRSYLRTYQAGGLAALKELHFRQPQSQWLRHRASLETLWRQHPARLAQTGASRHCPGNRDPPFAAAGAHLPAALGAALSARGNPPGQSRCLRPRRLSRPATPASAGRGARQ